MRFVTTYATGKDEVASVSLRTKFRSRGITIHYRSFGGERHYSLGTPAFLLEHLKSGEPVTWVDVRTRFNGYPDTIPTPKNYDIIATQNPANDTLHPSNFLLDPLTLLPTEQNKLLLKYWIEACNDAKPYETWEDTFRYLIREKELERLGIDFLLLPDAYIRKFYVKDKSSKRPSKQELREQLPVAITPYDTTRESARASLNIQQMNAESLGFTLVGVPKNKTGPVEGACLLSAYIEEFDQPVYMLPEKAKLRRVPWWFFTTHAELVIVGKPGEKLNLTHAFARNSYDAKLLLDQAAKSPEGTTNQEFVDRHSYLLVKLVDLPNSLYKEIFCEG